MHNSVYLSVVIPAYRSAEILPDLVRRLLAVLDGLHEASEVIVVEDGSPDKGATWEALLRLQRIYPGRLTAIQLMRNFGQHNALMCGLRLAQGRYVVTMDDDLQHPPEEIPKLIEAVRNNDFDLVYGRLDDKKHTPWRNAGSTLINRFYQFTFKTNVSLSSFRIIHYQLARSVLTYHLNYTFLDGLLAWNTQRIGDVSVKHEQRAAGRSGYNPLKLLALAINLFTNFSLLPLQCVSLFGFGTAVAGVGAAGYYLFQYMANRILVPGYASIIISVLVLGGGQLLALGILGEYIGRLHMNVNRKPQYVVRQVMSATDLLNVVSSLNSKRTRDRRSQCRSKSHSISHSSRARNCITSPKRLLMEIWGATADILKPVVG